MKDLGIRDELDVSRSEVHLDVNLRIVGNGLNQFKCFQLGVGQRRGLGMALGISDVRVALNPGRERAPIDV
jgi:hypothetical protein